MAPKKKESQLTEDADDIKASMETELVVALLKSRLGRYQEAGEKLAVEGFKLTDELAKQKLTLQDINEFLTNELKARSVATTQLEERVLELTAKIQDVQKDAQAEMARVRAEAAAKVEAATSRVAELSTQLEGSNEFLQQRDAMESQLTQLKAALAAKTKEVEQKLSDLERRHLQEKERARQEVAHKIRETKIAMAQLADQHLESSTKRTLAENEAMAGQLAYHEATSARLVEANNSLRAEAAELRRQLGVANKTVESTARKNLLLQQTIKAILQCLQSEGLAAPAGTAVTSPLIGSSRTFTPGVEVQQPVSPYQPQRRASPLQQQFEEPRFGCKGNANTDSGCGQHNCVDAVVNHGLYGAIGLSVAQAKQQGEGVQQPMAALMHQVLLQESTVQQQSEAATDPAIATLPVTAAGCDVAKDIVLQLEQQVLQLNDQLTAAKQALAAAAQGMLPDCCGVRVVPQPIPIDTDMLPVQQRQQHGYSSIGHSPLSSPSRESQVQIEHHSDSRQSHKATHHRSSCSTIEAEEGSFENTRHLPRCPNGGAMETIASPQQHHDQCSQNNNSCPGRAVRVSTQPHARGVIVRSRGSSPVSSSRHCSHKGATVSSSGCSAAEHVAADGMAAALDDGVAAFVLHCIQQLRYGSCDGASPQQQLAGGSKTRKSTCGSPVSKVPHHCSSTAAAPHGSGQDGDVVATTAAREQLARMLLDQLHGYARYKVAAFQGMSLELPGLPTDSSTAVGSDGAAEAAAATGGLQPACAAAMHAGCESGLCGDSDAGETPVQWLPPSRGAQAQQRSALPPLPTLLDMTTLAVAASNNSESSCATVSDHISSSPACAPAQDLFSAVLPGVQPWGSRSGSAPGVPAPLALGQQPLHSKTPPSPSGRHQLNPKLLNPGCGPPGMLQHHSVSGSSGNSRGSGANSPSAGRLAEAAGSAGAGLGILLKCKPPGSHVAQ